MGLFGKKKKPSSPSVAKTTPDMPIIPEKPGTPSGIPLEQVTRMRQQRMTDNQIVQTLQRNGYKSFQIFDAMNQADLTPGTPQHVEQLPTQAQQPDYPDLSSGEQAYEAQPQEFEDFEQPQPKMQEFGTSEMDRIEEVAEAIIDEKWSELMKNINKIVFMTFTHY